MPSAERVEPRAERCGLLRPLLFVILSNEVTDWNPDDQFHLITVFRRCHFESPEKVVGMYLSTSTPKQINTRWAV